jgi:hypothetical protein
MVSCKLPLLVSSGFLKLNKLTQTQNDNNCLLEPLI